MAYMAVICLDRLTLYHEENKKEEKKSSLKTMQFVN